MYCDFLGRAGDEVFNQIAKWQSMSAGILKMPLVLRISVGNKYGAQHSQDWAAIVNHIPGLKVYYPATPCDAKGMLNLALAGTDPVIFFEPVAQYFTRQDGVPVDHYELPIGKARIDRQGEDVTVVAYGNAVGIAADNTGKVLVTEPPASAHIRHRGQGKCPPSSSWQSCMAGLGRNWRRSTQTSIATRA